MNRTFFITCILACFGLQACSSTAVSTLPIQKLPLSKSKAVFVDVQSASLDISSAAVDAVEISGQVPASQEHPLEVTSTADGIHITLRTQSGPFWQPAASLLQLHLIIPSGATVNIKSFDAGMDIHDFTGNMNINAVSGNITVQNSQGRFAITSNRGNVSVAATSGEAHVAGNYGLLSLTNLHGRADASTIMGTVRFAGPIAEGDTVALETDHGPAEIQLGGASDATVQVRTTTGVVTCVMPGLHYDGQGCVGTLAAGQGRLEVRTVSGSVTLGEIP